MKRRECLVGGMGAAFLAGVPLSGCAGAGTLGTMPTQAGRYDRFRPGELWLDTAGKPIQAHAGSLIAVGDTFYWYGENKEFTDGKSGIESWGIRFYSSKDFYNWTDLGPLVPPDQVDPDSSLSPAVFPERPHILFNEKTGRFVMWIKIRGKGPQYRTIMRADQITGPWEIVHRELRPAGMAAGDFDLVQDPDTGQAAMYFEHDHKEIAAIDLTDDYLNVTDRYTQHLPGKPPYSREAPAAFWHDGQLYLTTSALTGYFPNPTRISVASGLHEPFTDLGLLHANDRTETSFGSQISDIFKVPGKKDLYIALADRWLPHLWRDPQFQSGELSRLVLSAIAKATAQPRQEMTPDERSAIRHAAALTGVDTSVSRYVWLPITVSDGRPTIHWRDEWKISDFG
jgi:hypothetical protein